MKAIEADNRIYSGYSMLAWVRTWTGELGEGCAAFKEALRLNPSDPYAIHGAADCLMLEGRMDESIARLRKLLVVSPFSAVQNRPLPYHLFLARRFDEALYWLNKAVDYGSYENTYLDFRPDFDVLRDDPRYRDLLEHARNRGAPDTR